MQYAVVFVMCFALGVSRHRQRQRQRRVIMIAGWRRDASYPAYSVAVGEPRQATSPSGTLSSPS